MEADDLMAILCIRYHDHFQLFKPPHVPTISVVSDDTDLYQLKAYTHVALFGNDMKPKSITQDDAKTILANKIKRGDPSDKIPSEKKFGTDFNRTLIDFRCIPDNVCANVIHAYETLVRTSGRRKKTKTIMKLPQNMLALVLHRPSKIVKSPYLADIRIGTKEYMAHSPSLGMSGMIAEGGEIRVSPIQIKSGGKATHRIQLVRHCNCWVGAIPLYANTIVRSALENKWLFPYQHLQPEYKIGNSRIDFYLENNGDKYLLEVKSVILKNREKAYFPDGYKKPGALVVSERALKHVEILKSWATSGHKAWLVYVVQRNDVNVFRLNVERDPFYASAVQDAMQHGVTVKAYKVEWTIHGCRGWKELDIIW